MPPVQPAEVMPKVATGRGSPMSQPVYELQGGRVILRNGLPILIVTPADRKGTGIGLSEAIALVVHIVSLLNFDARDPANG